MFKYKIITLFYVSIMLLILLHENPFTLLFHQQLSFHFNASPTVSEFFLVEPIQSKLSVYISQKVMHIIGFGFLYGLFLLGGCSQYSAVLLSVTFAFITEGLQLYFGRTGRLTDVGIDIIGILIAYWLSVIMIRKVKNS